MDLTLERSSATPLYRQIVEQVRRLVDSGRLRPGARLPTVRHVADQFHLTRLTVHTAYTELQSQGYVESFVGRGSFVSATLAPSHALAVPTSLVPMVQDRTQRRLGELMRLTERPDLLTFAQAIPAHDAYPIASFQAAMQAV